MSTDPLRTTRRERGSQDACRPLRGQLRSWASFARPQSLNARDTLPAQSFQACSPRIPRVVPRTRESCAGHPGAGFNLGRLLREPPAKRDPTAMG